MIFEHTWPAVLNGDKTETSRIALAGSSVTLEPFTSTIKEVYAGGRLRWKVGNTYAVQPRRARFALYWKPSPAGDGGVLVYSSTGVVKPPKGAGWQRATIKVLSIEVQELGETTEQNAYREGYLTLCGNHGGPLLWFKGLWKSLYGQWDTKQLIFRLRFELVGKEQLHGLEDSDVVGVQRLFAVGV